MSGRPTVKGMVAALVLGCLLTILAAEGVLRIAMPHWREFYSGWFVHNIRVPDYGLVPTGRPGFDGYFSQNNGDFRVRIRINDFGLRNPDPVDRADGRVWFIGDSMAFGWGVKQTEMYSSVAGQLLGTPTYNIASPGTDVCGYQALLARMPKAAKPRAVIIGLIMENDIGKYDCRAAAEAEKDAQIGDMTATVADPKIFLTRNTALFNFFAVSLKRVSFINKSLIALGLIERPHADTRQKSLARMAASVERTAAELEAIRDMLPPGIPFAVLIAPVRFEIRDGDPFFRKLRQEMVSALAKRNIPALDPIDEFLKAGFGPSHFAHDGHWSPLGHEIAGRIAADWLRRQGYGG
jgi:hypothetical protein